MRHRLISRVATPVAAIALLFAAAPAASADVLVTGGTSVLTVPATTLADLKAQRIVVKEASGAGKVLGTDGSRGISFTVTGGNADLTQLVGTADLAGSIKVVRGERSVKFNRLQLDLVSFQLTAVTAASKTRVPVFDLADDTFDPATGAFDSASATLTPEAEAVLAKGIGRTDLVAGYVLGSLTTTITSQAVVPAAVHAVIGGLRAV